MADIFAIVDKFVAFIADINAEAGKWIGMIVDFAKKLAGIEAPEEEPELVL